MSDKLAVPPDVVTNCIIITRDAETTPLFTVTPEHIIPHLNGYAILPVEQYKQLQQSRTGHDITSLRVCNGQGAHVEIVYDAESAGAKGCPVCVGLDALDLLERENHQLRCQLDAERSGAQEPLRD